MERSGLTIRCPKHPLPLGHVPCRTVLQASVVREIYLWAALHGEALREIKR